ncbi:MAG: futalosine hydrolase [Gaiellales bacterium]|nr:futalosine hydrolase [Gaiellales bacterium]
MSGARGALRHEAAGCAARALESPPPVGLVVATEVEARPLLNGRFRTAKSWEAAGRRWFVGDVAAVADDAEPAACVGPARETVSRGRQQPVVVVISGYDRANGAAATALLVERFAPVLVINFGIAGAFPGSGLALCDLVLATADSYADTGTSSPQGWLPTEEFGLPLAEVGGKQFWNTFPLSAPLVRGAAAVLRRSGWQEEGAGRAVRGRRLRRGPFVTLSQVTGTAEEALTLEARWGALAESMEGAACAHMCALYGIPCLEVRGISNLVGDRDRDRGRWDVTGAAAEAADAVQAVLRGEILELLRGRE